MEKTTTKKTAMWLIFKIIVSLFLTLLVSYIVLRVLSENGISFYFDTFSSSDICDNLRLALVILSPITLSVFLFTVIRNKLLPIIVTVVGSVICGLTFITVAFGTPDHTYHSWTSPDGKHEIIFQENVYFMMFDVDVYELTSENVMRKIGQCSNEYFYPYDRDTYEVEWSEQGFSVTVPGGQKSNEVLEFEFFGG